MSEASLLPFAAAEFDARLTQLSQALSARGLAAMVTFVQENQYWLCGYETTGFHSFPQALIVTADQRKLLVTRALEIENATERAYQLPAIAYQDDDDPGTVMARALVELGLSGERIGLEKKAPWVTVDVYEKLLTCLSGGELVDCSGMIELLRSVKSPAELDYMKQAARAVGAAVHAGIAAVGVGVSEFEIAASVSEARIRAGSHFTRNPTYIATGIRSALGHASWTGREVQAGEVVYFELGANIRHYDSALIRCAIAGAATQEMKDCHAASCDALEAALAALKPGCLAKEVHMAAKTELVRHGFGDRFDHRVGYGIGIEFLTWIERGGLSLDPGSEQVIVPNMTVHLIPFFKTPGKFTIGVSETVRVTETGAEVLETGCPRELFES